MKSQISRGAILIIIFMFAILMTGCGNDRYNVANKQADNEVSQAIYDRLGKKCAIKIVHLIRTKKFYIIFI